ncbi:MAG: potassium channel protein, partial [Chloroflexota bacterium]
MPSNRLRPAYLLVALFVFGTVGYRAIEGWSLFDSLYMTVITLTTVGYGEIEPLSQTGRIFSMFLMTAGIGVFALGVRSIAEYVISINLGRLNWEVRMQRKIDTLFDHVIVCGFGRVGQNAVNILRAEGKEIVIIDPDEEKLEVARERDDALLMIAGDATEDDNLLKAGLKRASSILVCAGDDTDNLFIVLSCRSLAPHISIIARASAVQNESKMIRAGANRVISPYRIGGQQMANCAIRPDIVDVLDVVTTRSGMELWMQDLRLSKNSPLVGKTLLEAHIREETGVTVILINRKGEDMLSPGANTYLLPNDHLIVIGTPSQVEKL